MLQQYIDEQSVTPLALNYDFGLITLASPAPNGTTTINIAAGEGSSVKYTLQTAGYPADEKPAQTMWQVTLPLPGPMQILSRAPCFAARHAKPPFTQLSCPI